MLLPLTVGSIYLWLLIGDGATENAGLELNGPTNFKDSTLTMPSDGY